MFAKNIARNYLKKIILGTSDPWLMRRSSHQPSDPSYYIEDYWIFSQSEQVWFGLVVVLSSKQARLILIGLEICENWEFGIGICKTNVVNFET